MLPARPVANICACTFLERDKRIEEALDRLEKIPTNDRQIKEELKDIRFILRTQKELYEQHVKEWRETYARNMVEHAKRQIYNANGTKEAPMQISVWKFGDVKTMYEPVQKTPNGQTNDKKVASVGVAHAQEEEEDEEEDEEEEEEEEEE